MLWRRWSGLPRTTRVVLLVYASMCAVLWFLPLLNRLHAESAAVVSAVAFFAAGLAALHAFRGGGGLWRVLARQEAALLVPWAMLTAAVLWAPNCAYGQGLLFFLLYAPVSVALAVGAAYALSATPWPRQGLLFMGIGLAVMVLGPLYDLGLHPQFYTYNHVFGGVLGPIYDEELVVRPGLLAFRGLTLLWALLLALVGRRLRERGPDRAGAAALPPYRIPVTALAIGIVYLFAAPLGINTPAWYVQRALGGHHATEHFDLYYDPAAVEGAALRRLAEDHEYRYAQLAERLGVAVPARIASYLYPDAETKGRLTGARTTNVAPVWLRRPQTHVLLDAYGRVFAHELAHVFSREFGMPVLRASPAVGLVEGLAVALEPPDGLPTPHEQVAAALGQRMGLGPVNLAEDVAARLSPLGFWTGRGAVSYTTLGSFVRYLLDAYGPDRLRRLYATADFDGVYGRPVEALAAEWEAFLRALPVVDRAAGALVQRRFAVPSLFERRCPHHVPRPVRRYRAAAAALAEGDTAAAVAPLYAALTEAPAYEPALVLWARLRLAGGAPSEVIARLDTMAAVQRAPALAVALGDAHALAEHPETARRRYGDALRALPLYARDTRLQVALRRSVADDPETLRFVVHGGPDSTRARRLAAHGAPAAAWLAAFAWSAAEAPARAAELLRTAPMPQGPLWTPALQQELARRRDAWRAELLHRAGRPAEARAAALRAAEAYARDGLFNEAAALRDLARKLGGPPAGPGPVRVVFPG